MTFFSPLLNTKFNATLALTKCCCYAHIQKSTDILKSSLTVLRIILRGCSRIKKGFFKDDKIRVDHADGPDFYSSDILRRPKKNLKDLPHYFDAAKVMSKK